MCRLMVANGLISFANGFFFPGFVVRWRGGSYGGGSHAYRRKAEEESRGGARWRLGDSGSWVSVLCDIASCVSSPCTHVRMHACSGALSQACRNVDT